MKLIAVSFTSFSSSNLVNGFKLLICYFNLTAIPVRKCDRTTEFDCGGGMCIPLKKVCDQKVDCPGGQDEPANKCTVNECRIANGGCEHICVDTPAAFYCDCHKG